MPGPGIDMTSLKRAPKHVGWEPQCAFSNDQHFRMPSSPKNRWENDDDDDADDDAGLWEVVGLTLRRSKKEEHPVCLNVQYLSCNCCLSRGKSGGLKSMQYRPF